MRVKEKIYNKLLEIVESKINLAKVSLDAAIDSRNNETKSSAGDKYETGREMIQLEINKLENQLIISESLKNELFKVNINRIHTTVDFGSLVTCNSGTYFISIGIGRVNIDSQDYYCISLASPIGELLHNKKVGDSFEFNGRKFLIENIV